jgi:hypothetical protein
MMICMLFASLFAFSILAIAPLTNIAMGAALIVVVAVVATYFAPKVRAWLKKERTVAHEGVEKILNKKD